ncbi:YrdB family protein [Lysinibacillus sp. NPDC086135]|uniref:YrdB family protein n=1 Tax=Lysinibacillus sp. NPDC086135 TaxID=3364130 RepID=UPI00382FD5C3
MFTVLSVILALLSAMFAVLSAILALLSAMFAVLSAMNVFITKSVHFISVDVSPYKNQFFGGILEICVLMAYGSWGIQTGKGMFFKLLLGIGAPAFFVVSWSMFGSPKATFPLNGIWHFMFEFTIFSLAVIALYATGRTQLAIQIIINQILLSVFSSTLKNPRFLKWIF